MKNILFFIILLSITESHAQCWQSIDAGGHHTVGVASNGTLWTWGYNEQGQLGDGTIISKNVPQLIGSQTDWQAISGGNAYTVALKTDGTLWAWGQNTYGQLGDGSTINRNVPVQIGTATNWVAVQAGYHHTIAKKSDGTLWAWGRNDYGQLGLGNNLNKRLPTKIGLETQWLSFDVGINHSVALKNDGSLWTWGWNSSGQLGDGTTTSKNIPTHIGLATWQSVDAGDVHTIAINQDGSLWNCGENFYGTLGLGFSGAFVAILSQVGTDNDWAKGSGGAGYTKALKIDGSMWAWGTNGGRTFGNTTIPTSSSPIQIGSEIWDFVSSGTSFSINIKEDLSSYVCGQNDSGQLGDGTNNNHYMLTLINCPVALSINQYDDEAKVLIYPNPAKDNLFLELNNYVFDNLTVYDQNGKVVLIQYENLSSVNIQNLQTGIYVLKLNFGYKSIYRKFVKY